MCGVVRSMEVDIITPTTVHSRLDTCRDDIDLTWQEVRHDRLPQRSAPDGSASLHRGEDRIARVTSMHFFRAS